MQLSKNQMIDYSFSLIVVLQFAFWLFAQDQKYSDLEF